MYRVVGWAGSATAHVPPASRALVLVGGETGGAVGEALPRRQVEQAQRRPAQR